MTRPAGNYSVDAICRAEHVTWMVCFRRNYEMAAGTEGMVLRDRHPSPRWKETVEPAPGRFTHHLEVYTVDEIDQKVCTWLSYAWVASGQDGG